MRRTPRRKLGIIRFRAPFATSQLAIRPPNPTVHIGSHHIENNLVVAPMAGVTDRPFRQLCKRLGAGLAVSEMVSSDPRLRATHKSRLRTDHQGEVEPIVVQIAGADPEWMADAARYNVDRGAQIIDINMGCPAKKVCNVAAGSALLRNESLVGAIVTAVVGAVDVPVTLKIRTGWSLESRNAVRVARIAEDAGIAALSVHGRTRECGFTGPVEYETIRAVKQGVRVPVTANGDIDTPEKAREVLERTGADAVMIGRAAQGRPWIFREIRHYLDHGHKRPAPRVEEIREVILEHLGDHYGFYGEESGVRVARKHLSWYAAELPGGEEFRHQINRVDSCAAQIASVNHFFDQLAAYDDRLADVSSCRSFDSQSGASRVEEALAA